MDTAIRTLSLRLERGGDPIPLAIPVHQEVARKTSMPLFPKNWASHLLRGEQFVPDVCALKSTNQTETELHQPGVTLQMK